MSDLTFVTVLKAGRAGYVAAHVAALRAGVARHLRGVRFLCLADMEVAGESLPLEQGWPGWWSKLELFRPDLKGPILYADLDTVITGSLAEIAGVGRLTLLSDFYHPEAPASGLMYLPEADRAQVWTLFTANPEGAMARFANWQADGTRSDGAFIGKCLGGRAARWQDMLPGQVVSYKVHVRAPAGPREIGNGIVPQGARVVCFHGEPRPWQLSRDEAEMFARRDRPTREPRPVVSSV